MSETLTTMLAAMPDGYQKTVGFPTYDLLAAASIPMEELAEELARTSMLCRSHCSRVTRNVAVWVSGS